MADKSMKAKNASTKGLRRLIKLKKLENNLLTLELEAAQLRRAIAEATRGIEFNANHDFNVHEFNRLEVDG